MYIICSANHTKPFHNPSQSADLSFEAFRCSPSLLHTVFFSRVSVVGKRQAFVDEKPQSESGFEHSLTSCSAEVQ